MEFITGFMAGGAAFWLLWALIILAILTAHNDAQKSTVFFALIIAVLVKYLFDISWATVGWAALAYIPIGLIWSFWRYRRHCERLVNQFEARQYSSSKEDIIRMMRPGTMIDKIVGWVVAWPFSMFESLAGDLINVIQSIVQNLFRRMYERTFEKFVERLGK